MGLRCEKCCYQGGLLVISVLLGSLEEWISLTLNCFIALSLLLCSVAFWPLPNLTIQSPNYHCIEFTITDSITWSLYFLFKMFIYIMSLSHTTINHLDIWWISDFTSAPGKLHLFISNSTIHRCSGFLIAQEIAVEFFSSLFSCGSI